MDSERNLLKHFLATIAYRTSKAVTGTSGEFGNFRPAPGVRTPKQLVRHMSDVIGYARTTITGGTWRAHSLPTWEEEQQRFYEVLTDLSERLGTDQLGDYGCARLLQGPLADAMSHAGQLSMLRRLAGIPIPPENFIVADIDVGQTGPTQPPPVSPDTQWFDAEEEPY